MFDSAQLATNRLRLDKRIAEFSIAWLAQAKAWASKGDSAMLEAAGFAGYLEEDLTLMPLQESRLLESGHPIVRFAASTEIELRRLIEDSQDRIGNLRVVRLNTTYLRFVIDGIRLDPVGAPVRFGLEDPRLSPALERISDSDFSALVLGPPLMRPRYRLRVEWLEYKSGLTRPESGAIMHIEALYLRSLAERRARFSSLD